MPEDQGQINFCVRCGEYLRQGVAYCPKCGAPVGGGSMPSPPAYPPPYYGQTPQLAAGHAKRPFYAGVLLVLAGLIGIAMAVSVFVNKDQIVSEAERIYGQAIPGAEGIVLALGVAWAIIGIVTIVGAYFSFQKKHYSIAVIGGVMGLFTGGLFLFEGSIMGLIALILILTSRAEFRR